MNLSFLSPLFLVGAAAAAIPIVIHLLNRRVDPVIAFAAVRYLRRTPVEQAHRRRLRELLLLALRVAALVLLAVAFARPYLSAPMAAAGAAATVVLVDTSASLSAPGQFERARTLALNAIDSAPPTHAVGVVSFANGAEVTALLSDDRAVARAAIQRLQRGDGATRFGAGLARAGEMIGDRPGRVVVVTDLQAAGWDRADAGGVPDRIAVEVRDVGGPETNLAVVALHLEGDEAVALVQNFSSTDANVQVQFALDARQVGAAPATVAAGATGEARVTLDSTGSVLTASITDPQGYAADNVRFAVLGEDPTPAILAVSASGHPSEVFYLERALSIADGARGFRFSAIGGPAFSDLGPEEIAGTDVIALLGTRGIEQRGRELLAGYVEAGGGILVAAGPDVDPEVVNNALGRLVQTTWTARDAAPLALAPDDSRHPIFRLLGGAGTLGSASFSRASLVKASDTADVVARYSDGSAALVEEQAGRGRVLVFASDLNDGWNDLPLQPAFVPFLHESLRYLTATRPSARELVVGDLAAGGGSRAGVVELPFRPAGPKGPALRGAGPFGPATAQGPAVRSVAVNIDRRESDPARVTVEEFSARVARLNATAARRATASSRDRESGQRLWQIALIVMILSLAAEGAVGRKLG
jgi:hypothetical protein